MHELTGQKDYRIILISNGSIHTEVSEVGSQMDSSRYVKQMQYYPTGKKRNSSIADKNVSFI